MKARKPAAHAPPLLIVTDLDGTLLDHHDYSFSAALPALKRLAQAGIPVVPNTSKTAAELTALRNALHLAGPYVVENGSAILIPPEADLLTADPPTAERGSALDVGHALCLGVPIREIYTALDQARTRYRFSSFRDWSVDELITHTGLARTAALAAQQRQYSEALLWQDSDAHKTAFIEELHSAGLHTLQGGRFLSVLGTQADKGRALLRLKALYGERFGRAPRVIALGDSDNDIAMLEAADIAVVIRNATRQPPQLRGTEVIYSEQTGPAGWNEEIQQLLDREGLP